MASSSALEPANDHDVETDAPLIQLLSLAVALLPAIITGETEAELHHHLTCALIAAMRLNLEIERDHEILPHV